MSTSMLERYGGFRFLSRMIPSFYEKALDSDILGPYFDGVDMRRLIDHQTKFVAFLMGGPASYTDETIRQVHAHLGIDKPSFEEMVTTFTGTCREHGMVAEDIRTIEGLLRARESVIVSAR